MRGEVVEKNWRQISLERPPEGESPSREFFNLKDALGHEYVGSRALFNNSGWCEKDTNKQIWPVWWCEL